ncbi:MAG: hypothetical protein IJR07_08555 [Bacteroidaceae bacterium]|nr:hypothetical protein [Bacteroidaceae bacterium]
MKRKMLFMAALAGLVVLGSCVKDDESASVTAIRNAKAAQLNADATYKQAQAANEQAQAAYNQADAAFRAAQARQQAVQAAIVEASQVSEIAKAIAQADRDAAQADETWQIAINGLKAQARQELDDLINRYQLAVTDYKNAVDDVLSAKADIKSAQLDKENAEKSLENSIKTAKDNLAAEQAKLAALKEIETTGMTLAEKNAAKDAKQAELDNAKSAFDQSAEVAEFEAAAAVLKLAKDAYDEANQAILDVNAINGVFQYAGTDNIAADSEPFVDFDDYTFNGGFVNLGDYWTWGFGADKYVLNETAKLNADRMYANNVTAMKDLLDDATDLLGTTADTKDTKTTREANKVGTDQQPTLYANLATAKAMPETTDAEKAAKKAAVDAAEDAIANKIDAINNPFGGEQANYDNAVADQKEFNDAFAAVDLDEYAEIIEAFQEAADNYNEAATAVDDLRDDVQALQDECTALNTISVQDIDDQIKQAEKNIADYEQQIAQAERLIDPLNAPLTYDEVIEQLELTLAKKEADLEVQAAKLAIAKEELEEAIGEFDAEEAEEPAADADADADTEG